MTARQHRGEWVQKGAPVLFWGWGLGRSRRCKAGPTPDTGLFLSQRVPARMEQRRASRRHLVLVLREAGARGEREDASDRGH